MAKSTRPVIMDRTERAARRRLALRKSHEMSAGGKTKSVVAYLLCKRCVPHAQP